MQPMTKELLEQLIVEARAAGEDTSDLENALTAAKAVAASESTLPFGQTKHRDTAEGEMVIESTGPAREEDFE